MEDEQPKKTNPETILQWRGVVGGVAVFILGVGVSFMTSWHPIIADLFFLVGSGLLLAKFLLWELTKQHQKKRMIQCVAISISLILMIATISFNHYINYKPTEIQPEKKTAEIPAISERNAQELPTPTAKEKLDELEKRMPKTKSIVAVPQPDLRIEASFNTEKPDFTIYSYGPGNAEQIAIYLLSHYFKNGKIKMSGFEPFTQYAIRQLEPVPFTRPLIFPFDKHWLNVNARLQEPLQHNIIEIRLIYHISPDLTRKFQKSAFYFINPEGRWVSENDSSLITNTYDYTQMKKAVLEASEKVSTELPFGKDLHQIQPSTKNPR